MERHEFHSGFQLLIMSPARAAAYIGGASLLLAWLAAASGVARQPRHVRVPSRPGDAAVLQTIASDVQSQASRLRQRLATAPAPKGPVRNPFAFGTREVRDARRMPLPLAPTSPRLEAERVPVEPSLSLLGIAEQNTPAGLIRTAMISTGGDDLIMVTEGQTVAVRYRVVAIGADAVELKDVATGATRRLALQ